MSEPSLNDTPDTLIVAAPLSGWCATLDDSPDAVFRDRILGDGASIDPTDNVVLAPFDAEVIAIPESKHAVSLRADNGAELLIHVGIDTVELAGEGFASHVQPGDRVKQGQRLLSFDPDAVMQRAVSLRTPVVLLHDDAWKMLALQHVGPVQAGDALFTVMHAIAAAPATEPPPTADNSYSKTVFVGLTHGIHARPAALLVDSIKGFDAVVTCEANSNKSANGRSAVALLAMGVGHGSRLTVTASGADAVPAIAAFVARLEPLPVPPAEDVRLAQEAGVATRPVCGAVIRAQPAATGLAIGPCLQIRAWEGGCDESSQTPDQEQQLLEQALATVRQYLAKLAASQSGAGREIACAHLSLVEDPTIAEQTNLRIRQGTSAAVAWQQSVVQVAESLRQLDDRRMRERVDDLQDINQRVQRVLAGYAPEENLVLPQDAVIVAHTLLPSQLLELDRSRVAAICTAAGGTTSHVAILAASMDIPMLVAAGDTVLAVENDSLLAVDAEHGELQVRPDEDKATEFRLRVRGRQRQIRAEQEAAGEQCVTSDGIRIHVNANVASPDDAHSAVQRGADGCGLLRTEFVFMDRLEPPDAQQQLRIYQQISDALGERPLIVRTLDAGGDKPLAYIDQAVEENPALGVRGIRLSLANKAMLETQLDALLQLRRPGVLQVMIPMITSVHEVCEVRRLIDDLRQTRNRRGQIQLGVMVETPAAAVIADKLAEIVDFFSIGTNDLTQYTLAMDRGEPSLAARLDTLHPAVLRLIDTTARAANEAGKPVAVCGGAAGDILAAPILIGMGIRELSMVPALIARQKAHIRRLSVRECAELAGQALAMDSAREVRTMMRGFMSAHAAD